MSFTGYQAYNIIYNLFSSLFRKQFIAALLQPHSQLDLTAAKLQITKQETTLQETPLMKQR